MSSSDAPGLGPILHFRGHDAAGLRLAAVVVRPEGAEVGTLDVEGAEIAPRRIALFAGHAVWRFDFVLAPGQAAYVFEGERFEVSAPDKADLRIAFTSCNGEENGDLDREAGERNAMWDRLAAEHAARPFALLLQGGDQIYADEVTRGHPLSAGWPEELPARPSAADLEDLGAHLRRAFLERYLAVFGCTGFREMAARVPTLAIWDDHDICDGWGSLPGEPMETAVGQVLFKAAREAYLLLQHGAAEADIAEVFADPSGQSLGWRRELPGLTLIAPDLRSERGRQQVMARGWELMEAHRPEGERTLMVSSVPLLGPRLSLIERFIGWVPKLDDYEDDLRDQWQSRAHRESWKRALREVLRWREGGPVTVLSGEIHLATRAEMAAAQGPVHQLVASGIAHRPPPKGYARGLGWLGTLGEAPLPEHPIRILPLPGMRRRYVAERNFLVLERRGDDWQAVWHLEESGPTPPLPI
ncbi:alkaline phosphatase D family protein [Limimaricola pyoseonensis]|uniref:PhoD-like phosphatase domain-containing protein n=1 Tax=Limimaricola pyoseonensis TaxID=521013 RepID=A0A1G7FTL2_9RHOB|nr:alkaline phosphatase D family protein [Limimaricola pyoseonensis]SDE79236.1 hypothetical protein SAMN04488567_2566 [Limimaricola pyoseonensis]